MDDSGYQIVDYSEYSIAIFGDTKVMKEEIKALGGKFNVALNKDGGKAAGWILPKKQRGALELIVAAQKANPGMPITPVSLLTALSNSSNNISSSGSSSTNSNTTAGLTKIEVSNPPALQALSAQATNLDVNIVDYSEYSIAIFGDTKVMKEEIKALGGKFNVALNKDGGKAAGWILSKKQRGALEQLLSSKSAKMTSSSTSESTASAKLSTIPADVLDKLWNGSVPSELFNSSEHLDPYSSTQATASAPLSAATTEVEGSGSKKRKPEHVDERNHNSGYQIVDYSEYSIAIFGDTKVMKEEIKALDGKFNVALNKDGGKAAGWILSKKQRGSLDEIIQKHQSV